MGISLSFPVAKKPPCFHMPSDYKCTGLPAKDLYKSESKWIGRAITEFMEDILKTRRDIIEAKRKFIETDFDHLTSRFPLWSTDDIIDLKVQFQSFDLNNDGLIDFPELCLGLEDLGDTSSMESRRAAFLETDTDNSGAVDFEEYLTLVARSANATIQKRTFMQKRHSTCSSISRLGVWEQIENRVF